MNSWRLLWDGHRSPFENMARDEALFRSENKRPSLRIYGWDPPGLSLGYFQRSDDDLASASTITDAMPVRRPTGGGAILHQQEVTYCLVLPADHSLSHGIPLAALPVPESYDAIHSALARTLSLLDITSGRDDSPRNDSFFCFDRRSPHDLIVQGKKIAGSAQRRSRERILQHGSMKLRGDDRVSGSIGVNDLIPAPMTFDELGRTLVKGFEDEFGVKLIPGTFDGKEEAAATSFASRYKNLEWRQSHTKRD